jgi:hypothetical protein
MMGQRTTGNVGGALKRTILVLAVAALMAALMVAMAAPAFAIPGNGRDVTGKHNGFGDAPFTERNNTGDLQNFNGNATGSNGNAWGDSHN